MFLYFLKKKVHASIFSPKKRVHVSIVVLKKRYSISPILSVEILYVYFSILIRPFLDKFELLNMRRTCL